MGYPHILQRKKLAKEIEEVFNSFQDYFNDFFFGDINKIRPKDYISYKTHRKQAFHYLEKKEYKSAIKSFTKAMKEDQENNQVDLRLGKARALVQTNDVQDEAINHYTKVIQTYSSIPFAQIMMLRSLFGRWFIFNKPRIFLLPSV